MITQRTHKIKIFPTPEQERYLYDCAFVARSAWNFALGHAIAANTQVVADWRALSNAERLAFVPYAKEEDKERSLAKWLELTDEDRLKRAPTSWGMGTESKAWTELKRTVKEGDPYFRAVQVAKTVPATIAFDVIYSDMKKAFARFFKLEDKDACSRRKKGKPCWCIDYPTYMWAGHPRFKNSRSEPSFSLRGATKSGLGADFTVSGDKLVVRGREFKLAEHIRFQGRQASARVFKDVSGWYITVSVEVCAPEAAHPSDRVIGIDLGVKAVATTSSGEAIRLNRSVCLVCGGEETAKESCSACFGSGETRTAKKDEGKINRLKAILSNKGIRLPCLLCKGSKKDSEGEKCKRCVGSGDYLEMRTQSCPACAGSGKVDGVKCRKCKGFGKIKSNRVLELERKVAQAELDTKNRRNELIQQTTTRLANENCAVVFEDIDFAALREKKAKEGRAKSEGKKARGFQRAIADASPGEFRRQLEYKLAWNGGRSVRVPAAYTSRTCSDCGRDHGKMDLSVRQWICDGCFALHDRDVNAAINILKRGTDLLKVERKGGKVKP